MLDVNHATDRCVSISLREPKLPVFPTFWEMRWSGDLQTLAAPKPVVPAAAATRQVLVDLAELEDGESAEPGETGRVRLGDGRVVEYQVPALAAGETRFLVSFGR